MKLISYMAHPDRAAENRGKIEAVFAALEDAQVPGVSYLVIQDENGGFFHLVDGSPEAIAQFQALPAFGAFSSTASERQLAPSVRRNATVLGSYGMTKAQ